MAKIETNSLYASLISGSTIQSDNFNFTGSLVLSNDLLADAVQTHNIGAVSGSFNDIYARAISNPDISSDLQINSSNGGDINFTINGSNKYMAVSASDGHLNYFTQSLAIKCGDGTNKAVTIAGGNTADESTGARISCFGETSADPGAVRIYASSTAGRPIRFYTDGSLRWNMVSGHFVPSSNSNYDVGSSSQNCRFVYTNVVTNSITSNALDIQSLNGGGIQFNIDGTSELFMDGSTLRPNTNGGMNLGATTHRYGSVYASNFENAQAGSDVSLRASDDIVFSTNGVNRWVIFDPGVLRPNLASTYDIGTSATRCLNVWSDNFVPFTGMHLFKIKDGESLTPGDAVCLISEEVLKCTESLSPTCIGLVVSIISGSQLDTTEEGNVEDSMKNTYSVSGTSHVFAYVAQCGDNYTVDLPGFKICDENGPVNAGDLLCTASGHPGYLKKWTPDINTLNCIVGKSYEDVTFSGGLAEEVYGTLKG